MVSIKLFWVLLLGVVASSSAASIEVNEMSSSLEVGELEAPPEGPISDVGSLNDTGSSKEGEGERGLSITSEGQKRCSCDNISCRCCVNPKIPIAGKIETCLKVTVLANQKSVNVELSGKNKVLIGHRFVIGARERMCASVPGAMSAVQGCIDTDTSNLPKNAGIQTCPKLELRAVGKTVATLSFACIQYSNRKVSFNNNGPVKANQKVGFRFF